MQTDRLIRTGLWAAGLANIIGITVVSLFFTNEVLAESFPELFSLYGNLLIFLWGCAYIVSSAAPYHIPWIFIVFAVEKAVYVVSWVFWYAANSAQMDAIMEQSGITWFFLTFYGANDLLWGLMFVWVFIKVRNGPVT